MISNLYGIIQYAHASMITNLRYLLQMWISYEDFVDVGRNTKTRVQFFQKSGIKNQSFLLHK